MTTPSPIVTLNMIAERELLKPGQYIAVIKSAVLKKHKTKDSNNINIMFDVSSMTDASPCGVVFHTLPDCRTSPGQGYMWAMIHKAFEMQLDVNAALTPEAFKEELEYCLVEQTPAIITVATVPATYFKDSDGIPTDVVQYRASNKITKFEAFTAPRTN